MSAMTPQRAPKTGEFIIMSIMKSSGACSISSVPGVHTNQALAMQEAARLSRTVPEKKFGVVQVKGIASFAEVSWE